MSIVIVNARVCATFINKRTYDWSPGADLIGSGDSYNPLDVILPSSLPISSIGPQLTSYFGGRPMSNTSCSRFGVDILMLGQITSFCMNVMKHEQDLEGVVRFD